MAGITDVTLVQTGVDDLYGRVFTVQVQDDLVEDVGITDEAYQLAKSLYGLSILRDVLNTQLNVTMQYGVDMDYLMTLLETTFATITEPT